jgi:hypothetical protein
MMTVLVDVAPVGDSAESGEATTTVRVAATAADDGDPHDHIPN